ncbi:MAG: alpha-glucan family phosphorylase [Pseudomonadota bacterium]
MDTQLKGSAGCYDALAELALDMRWSWNHRTDQVWRQLDPVLWDLTHNPWVILQTAPHDQLERLSADPDFCKQINDLMQSRREAEAAPAWFQLTHSQTPLSCVAYFSMEFMLSEALPIYSGGLGNVAGDQLKAASDLGVPIIAVGLLYQRGYFRQVIDKNGTQQALYPYNEPGQLPITPLRKSNGEWVRLEVSLPGYSLWLRAWQVQVGRVRLYLLDSNDAANFPAHRGITSELYGGGAELRLQQELVLGIGGWRMLTALGIKPEVCHLNEGHAGFAALERARQFMEESGQPFDVALAVTRAGNLFTTHTAVSAGFDRYSPALMRQYLDHYAEGLHISMHDFMALGRQNPADETEDFNMAYLAIRSSGAVNGVSRLHGKVSRQLFSSLFPRWPLDEVPVAHVTNGVHMPTWDSVAADKLWTEAGGKDRWLGTMDTLHEDVRDSSDKQLWELRTEARLAFVNYVRKQYTLQLCVSGAAEGKVEAAQHLLNPNVLTLGFARRFATYKRPNLLLRDPERLRRLLTSVQHPVQLVLAGKAHPEDAAGKALIQQWTNFIASSEPPLPIIFLADYDMQLAEQMVQGVDVWINTPRRPWEACGTSGMKVLVNGGINLSELDGWWSEAYTPQVGWALGDGKERGEDSAWDAVEAEALYTMLEREVIPEYYARDQQGLPVAWLARMRESMALAPQFSANRSVREYVEKYYIPAAAAYTERAKDSGAFGLEVVQWRNAVREKWAGVHFGTVKCVTRGEHHLYECQVYLDGLEPGAVRVELFAYAPDGAPLCAEMQRSAALPDAPGGFLYRATVSAQLAPDDYTARIVPCHDRVAVPLEAAHILWQK